MALCCGANEAIVADPPVRPEREVALGDGVAMLLRCDATVCSGALNLLTVFINPGDEHHVIALEPLKAGQSITSQRGVGAAEMGFVVDVIERGREAVGHLSDVCSGQCPALCDAG